jgi:extracellular elastinolytic metalloproteinase
MIFTMPSLQRQYVVIVGADGKKAGGSPGTEILYCQETSFSVRARGTVYTHNPGIKDRELVDFPRPIKDYPFDPSPTGLHERFPSDWCENDSTLGNNTIAVLGEGDESLKGTVGANGLITFAPEVPDDDDQKRLNIFYFCNYMHDFFYMLGFDEASGNFQEHNIFTNMGLAGDSVLARAHPGEVDGTANMLTLADGQQALMNMGLVGGVNLHTALDSDVVFHEFVHGVTNRLVGGRRDARGLQQPQSRGMGEGWSDYFALTIQNHRADEEKTVTGDWVTGQEGGIRMHPYR